jgi:uncharacterized membrane protein HdeD (DUF308 family)
MRARRRATAVLLVLASVLLTAAMLAAYAWRVLFDPGRFSARAVVALKSDSVREVIAARVTDELVRRHPDLLAVRPALVSAVSGVVGGDAFAGLFRRGVRDVHGAVFRRERDTVTLTVVDVGIVLAEALRVLEPERAAEIAERERVSLAERALGNATGDLVRLARDVRVLAYVLVLLAAATAAAAVALAADRRRAASQLGLAIVVAGVVTAIAELTARTAVLDRFGDPDARAAAAAVWDAYLGDLRSTAWLIAGMGAVLAAAAASLIRPIEVEQPLRAAWRIVSTEPRPVGLRLLRGAALIAVGVLVIAQPVAVLRIVATLGGVYALYKGLETILRLLNGPPAEAPRERRRFRPRRLAAPAVAILVVAGAATAFAAGGGLDEPVPAVAGCNGRAELCDRPFDEVALPATHNSMSVPLPGWFASLHERPIAGQLEDGIRGLLFDTHYADRLANGRTRTYFGGPEAMRRAMQQDGVSQGGVEAALRLRDRLGFRGSGERGMYLCHTFCELGSTPLAEVLNDIHRFLVTHPGDVLAVINQDYVTPADFVAALTDAGLDTYALEPPRGADWPTLREMIDRDRRLVVLAENHAGTAPWYQLVYGRLTQETPFTFTRTGELTDPATLDASCRPNRGTAGAPLFLVNHWINTDPLPRPGNATVVNAFEPLLRRARACERVRGHPVNLLAVDFYERGDVFKVVDALNAAPQPRESAG